MNATYEKILEEFKGLEIPSDVFMIVDYPALRLICSLWNKVQISSARNNRKVPSSINDKWSWLWDTVDYNIDLLMEATGFIDTQIEDIIVRLKAGRLIYPDGTIHNEAVVFLESALTYGSISRNK